MKPMQPLPIDALLPELIETLGSRAAVVLEAPPGAGKTTRVPRAILDAGLGRGGEVIVTEPRRLAARMAARRVADEHGERLGGRVGYRVRFEEAVSDATQLFYVTEGVLLRRLLADPKLKGVGAVVLDEFHERHLDTELLLGLLAELKRTARPDLQLVVMSATLDAEPVAAFLDDCPRLRSEGRMFPLTIEHLPEPDDRPLEKQVVSAVRTLVDADAGDVLVFLPGASEIRRAQAALEGLARERGFNVTPLHGDLPIAEQAKAIEPSRERKVVLSTNVAESSVTIEGVTGVVDSGLARVAGHSPWTGLPTLETAKISRASAIQRAGRAGRTRAGRVLRLYTKGDFASRPEHDLPEIARADLTESLLVLKGAGAPAAESMRWLTPPRPPQLAAALELLTLLGAIDGEQRLTEIGRRMLDLPLHPRLARIVIEGERRGVADTAALIAALLGERDLRLDARTDFSAGGRQGADTATGPSDLLELVDAFELARSLNFQANRLRSHGLEPRSVDAVARAERQLLRLTKRPGPRPGSPEGEEEALLVAVLSGFADRLARRRKVGGLELLLANGRTARLSPASVVRNEELLVAVDVDERRGRGPDSNVRLASAVRPEWLLESYSDRLALTEELVWNATSERVEHSSRMTFGAIALEESQRAAAPSAEASAVLARAVSERGAQEFLKMDALTGLATRLDVLAQHVPELNLPRLDAQGIEALVLSLCDGLTSFAELRALDPAAFWLAQLGSNERRALEEAVPESIVLPGGRRAPIHYEAGKPPWLESRLQDFFGMAQGPRLCRGRLAVTLHLLAPNARAVQVTQDLEGFWQRHYPGIRRELMRRYPRHSWPEDGRTAVPPPPRKR